MPVTILTISPSIHLATKYTWALVTLDCIEQSLALPGLNFYRDEDCDTTVNFEELGCFYHCRRQQFYLSVTLARIGYERCRHCPAASGHQRDQQADAPPPHQCLGERGRRWNSVVPNTKRRKQPTIKATHN